MPLHTVVMMASVLLDTVDHCVGLCSNDVDQLIWHYIGYDYKPVIIVFDGRSMCGTVCASSNRLLRRKIFYD
jgi:hypothetical protein